MAERQRDNVYTTNNPIFFAYDAAGGTTIPNSWTDVTFDTEVLKHSIYIHSSDGAEVEIRRNNQGWYKIIYEGTCDVSDSSRSHSDWKLVKNDGSGYSDVDGSFTYAYHRTSADGKDNASCTYLIYLYGTEKIKVQAKSDRTTQISTVADSCRLFIEKVG